MSTSSSSPSSSISCCSLLVCDQPGEYRPASADEVLQAARRVLSSKVRCGSTLTSPEVVKDLLRLHFGGLEHEVFVVVFLDAQHRLIGIKAMFRGLVSQTSVVSRCICGISAVYAREVVKADLRVNTAAVLLSHNHP